jgi:hypothetical protein
MTDNWANRLIARTVLALAFAAVALSCPAVAPARPSSPTPTPAPTPTPVADPAVTKIIRQQFLAWQSGSIDKSLYAPQVLSKLTDAKIDDVAHALGALGPLANTVYVAPFIAPDMPPDARGYIYQMQCTEGNIYLWMILDGSGKIASIFFKDRMDVETIERPGTPPPNPPH